MSSRNGWLVCIFACASLAASNVGAQTAVQADAAPMLEEIMVTAQKRSESLSNVPMSITAATGEQLEKLGITQVSDLQKIVPSFSYQPSYLGTPVYTLRGVGFQNPSVAAPPAVSVYLDQVPLPYPTETRGVGLDLERVEVLQGPQGTLFGQNSTGGAVNYIAHKPTSILSGGMEVGVANYDAYNFQGFVSGPLSNTVSARVALSTDQRGDWQRSETRADTLGRRDFTSGRVLLDWAPHDRLRFELNLNGWVDKSDTQAVQFVKYAPPASAHPYTALVPALTAYQPAPDDNRIADWLPGTSYRRNDNFFQSSLRGDWEIFPALAVTSITTYSHFKQDAPMSGDGTNVDDFFVDSRAHIDSFAQELRLSGQLADDQLKWMLGGNYAKDNSSENAFLGGLSTKNGAGSTLFYQYAVEENNQKVDTKAAFGSLDYSITRSLTFRASSRYTQSNTSFTGCLRDAGDGKLAGYFSLFASAPVGAGQCVTLDPETFAPVGLPSSELDEHNVSWRTGLDWKLTTDTLLYVNVTQGYKSGGYSTIPFLFTNQIKPVVQESLLAYEVGFKQAWFDNTLQLTGAAFYYDYSNKQLLDTVPTILGPLPGLVTIPKSRVTGGELSIAWRPLLGLTVSGGASYVDSKVIGDPPVSDPYGRSININGAPFPVTPKWQLHTNVEYDRPITAEIQGYVGAGSQYRDRSNATFGGGSEFELPSYVLLDLRAGVTKGDWRLEFWGRNVTNRNYAVNVTHFADTDSRAMGMPATYGARLAYKF
ncbi:MAG TPA: TonB-dependent receptor [Steroidobacteraceae bacterium]|nr:TonB-dependent receptor [Steroidobacteraceae bacterium]